MAGPSATVTPTNVLAGPGQLWWGIFGTAVEPIDPTVTPGVGFTDAGGTDGGLTVVVNQSFFTMRVDQLADAVGSRLTQREVRVQTNLAEGTLENLAIGLNHDPTTAVVDEVGPPAFRHLELEAGQDVMRPQELVIIVDGWAPGLTQLKRRTIVRRVNSVENISAAWQKEGQWMIPVAFSALYVDATTSPVAWQDEVAP